jgi:sigma-B regulation protein RsbU (phosphoserine phosphatase)
VAFAEDGSEALQRAAETTFDIILLDLVMPPPNGLEVLQELSRKGQLNRTFVIIISGLDDASNASLAIRLGAVEVLARPVDFNRLRARVEACLHRQRARTDREEVQKAEIAQAKILMDTFSSSRNATYSTLRVQGFIEQATEMGVGDFFFHYPLSPRRLLAGVGDVTGKGLPAALDMARFVALIKHTVKNCTPANFADWLVELNNTMYGVIKDGENAAALTVLLFDLESRRVHLAAFAQHFPLRRDYVTGMWNPVPCPRYKLFAHRELQEVKVATVCLAAGSHWLLHSDGITEATLISGSALEQEGVVALLQGGKQWPNYELSTFVESWKQSLNGQNEDDATLLLIQNQELPPPLEFSGLLTLEKISEARDFFEQWAHFAGLSAEATTPVLIGCDEILNNIFRHAYASEPAGQFSCVAVIEPTILRFVIRHSGKGISDVEAQTQIPRRREGGLGLKLVGHVFSRVRFSAGDSTAGAEIVLEKDLFKVLPR